MPKSFLIIFCVLSFHSFSQVVGGRNNSEMTPQVSKPSELSSGVYSGDVNLFTGDYNSSIQLGAVATPSGLSYSLSLNYSSAFAIGNTMPVSTGIPYGEGWNLNIPTISIETEVFNNFTVSDYCTESGISSSLLNFNSLGNEVLKEGDVYWFSPYINIPGVASGRAVFKYIDVNDDKTAVFELNAFENHVEIRYNGGAWVVIVSDGTRYTFRTAIQSYNAPANKRVLYYDQAHTGTGTNNAEDVQVGGYQNASQASSVENSILPKQKYNLWYCDVITHRNQPFQAINFTYKGFGKFNYFKEFNQEAYKYAAAEEFLSSTFAKDHDFSCYADLLLLKVEAISIDGLVDRLELNYATDKGLIQLNSQELINYDLPGNGRLDSLYSYKSIYDAGIQTNFESGWKRYEHTKANSTTNPDAVSPVNPYIKGGSGYVRSDAYGDTVIAFSHSFLESPRLVDSMVYPGDIYEVRSRIKRSNGATEPQLFGNAGTFDLRIVTGDLGNPKGLNGNTYSAYNNNSGIYFPESAYNSSRSKVLYSTFNMALKWSLNYGEGDKMISNLFVMPNIPSKYGGFNFQIGPGNSDMNYAVSPPDIYDSPTSKLLTENAYICRYGNPGSFALKSAADIPGNFGIGLPWNMVSPIYEYMITHENTFSYATGSGKEAYHFWWNFNDPGLQNGVTTANSPTKLDASVKLSEFELIRYSKNPYMLVGVKYYKVNGDVGGPVETGLKLIAHKKLEYTSEKCNMLENYDYENGDVLKYRNTIKQVFVLLKAVREVPLDWTSDTTKLLTTFFSYSKFNNTATTYQDNQPMNGHFGMVLTKVVDYLGGITQIEYYPANDSRTRYTGSFSRERSAFCGVVSNTGYGLSRAEIVHPVVKYVLKNDEDDLVKNGTASSNNGHKRWFYDFDTNTKVKRSALIQVTDTRFYNGRRFNFDAGFKKVSVYGPSLIEGGNEFVNRTDYEHYGGDFDYLITFPSIEDYLYHGKLKSVKEYDVNNKLFTEKIISYEYTLAYKNGYTRPNPYREDLVWEQEYDDPGGQYEYRDYYLNQPVSVTVGSGPGATVYTGSSAYPYLDIPVFNGSGDDFELPKFLEFEFYPILDTTNPSYMFHSYFVKKKEEINRKYDDYLYKNAVISTGTLPVPFVNTGPNPFGSGYTNPVVYNAPVAASQISLINTATEAAIVDSLTSHSPLMDSVLYHVINTARLSDPKKIILLLTQGNLSNLTLKRFISKYGPVLPSPAYSSVSVIQQQTYISDDVLLTIIPKIASKWNKDLIRALFKKNAYLSDTVVQALAGSGNRYIGRTFFTEALSSQPQFSEGAIHKILKSRNLIPADLPLILKTHVITDEHFDSIIVNSEIVNNTIVEIIETGNKYPSEAVFNALMARSPAFSLAEIERIIAVADRDIEQAVLDDLILIYGPEPFLKNFVFTGNPLDAYCNNAVQAGWNYMETKTTYEYYEADYLGTSNGRAYKVLMALEDIPGRTVSSTDIFGTGGVKTINSLRLKHEPSWQVFSVTNTSVHLPTAKDEKQFFYLYDLKNRYDRYWYNYDLKTMNGIGTSFDYVLLNNDLDTVMFTTRWDSEYVDAYMAEAPVLPKYDGMAKSRQYGMRTTPFQQTQISKNQRDAKELRKSEYYFYDARWAVDAYSTSQTVEYDGPSCPGVGTPPADPVGCESCIRWKNGTEEEFIYQLPFNYCLWKDPVVGYYACPSSINYAACYPGVELIACNPDVPEEEEEGGPSQMIILTDALKKSLQLRSTIIQVDTVLNAVSTEFSNKRFDRSNTQVADFYMDFDGTDAQNFIRPFKMLFPYDTLTTARVHKRNQHLQPVLISNSVGLLTKFWYRATKNKWNVDTNCNNPNYSFYYNYSSVEMRDIGLPVHVTVGYLRADSMGTDFEYTSDGQVSKMTVSSGHTMKYDFDGFNRLTRVTENGTRLLSRNEYQLWKHDFSKTFKQRTAENYVYSVLFQSSTDTSSRREFQKAFIDPLGRTAGVVRAYRNEGDMQVSSGAVLYDNWGRPQVQFKPIASIISVTPADPLKHIENLSSLLYHETKYDNDPGSLDIKHADPGESISGFHTVNKQTWITNAIYMSCELRLNRTELNLVMNSGATGNFRFFRTSVTDQDGKETITYTNAIGQTVATFAWANMAEKVVTLYVYDSYGNLMKTINALRQHTDYQYNILGQLVRETNTDGGEKRYIYNKHGKISGVQDQLDRNNVNTSNIPAPRFRKFDYDMYGNMTGQTLVTHTYRVDPFCFENKMVGAPGSHYFDGSGNEYYFDYVFTNRMTQDWLNQYKSLNPLGGSTEIVASGLPTAGATTTLPEKTMLYGTAQASPSTLGKLIESYSYSPAGTAIQKIAYTYNTEDLLASQVITQHPSNIATNDQFLVKATISYPAYNFRGSLLEEKLDMGSNGSVELKYFYEYDQLNRLQRIYAAQNNVAVTSATQICSYVYDEARGTVSYKRLHGETPTASQIIAYSYDDRDRLTRIESALFSEQLYYDNALIPGYNSMAVQQANAYNGNIKGTKVNYSFASASNSVPLFSKETVYGYQYDRINRLVVADALVGDFIDAHFANGSNTAPAASFSIGDEEWRYDRIGNIVTQYRTKPGTAVDIGTLVDDFVYTYANGTNRLMAVDDAAAAVTRNYTYDANGNLLTDDYRDLDATVYIRGSYPYQVTQAADNSYYLYDGADQRIAKKVVTSAQTTQEMYIKDALGRDLSIVKFTTVGATTTQSTEYFVYGTDRVARITASVTTPVDKIQPDEMIFFLYDHLGNNRVAFSVNSSNVPTILNAMDYYSYGKILREYDNGQGDRYLTTQHERDQKTGLDYRGARYYDSDIARFLSLDPLAAKYPSWSPYNYVMGNPISLIDPTGKSPDPVDKFDRKFNRWKKRHADQIEGLIGGEVYDLFKTSKNIFGRENSETKWFRAYENVSKLSESTGWHVEASTPGRTKTKFRGSASTKGSTSQTLDVGASKGEIKLYYNMETIPDRLVITNDATGEVLFDTRKYSSRSDGKVANDMGSGEKIAFDLGENNTQIKLEVNPGESKTNKTKFSFYLNVKTEKTITNPEITKTNP